MANRIKGITVEIGGDTTGLDKALKGVNSSISKTQTALRDVNRLLKLDPTNTELIAQKQRYLQDATTKTKEKLEALKKADSQAKEQLESGKLGQDKYDALQREIADTETKLKGLEKQAKDMPTAFSASMQSTGKKVSEVGEKISGVGTTLTTHVTAPITAIGVASTAAFTEVDAGMDIIVEKTGAAGKALEDMQNSAKNLATQIPTDFETAGSAIGEVNTRFGFTGQALEDLSGKFIKFSELNGTDVSSSIDSTQKVLEAFGLTANHAGDVLDSLNYVGQATGISMETLSGDLIANAQPLKDMGFNAYQAATFLGEVEKSGADVSTVMAGLKKAEQVAAEGGQTLDDALKGFSDTMNSNKSDTEKLQAAYDLFGKKAGAAIFNAVKTGSLSFDDLKSSAEDSLGSVDSTFESTLDPIDQFQLTLNQAKIAGADIGNSLFTILAPALEKLASFLKDLSGRWQALSPGMQDLIVKFALIAAAIGPVTVAVGKFVGSIGTIITNVPQIIGMVSTVGSAVTKGFGLFTKLGDAVKGLMTAFIGLPAPVLIVVGAIAAAIAIGVLLYKNWDKIKEAAGALEDKVVEAFNEIKDGIINALESAKNTAINIANAIKDGIIKPIQSAASGVKSAISKVPGIVKSGLNGAVNYLKSLPSQALKWGKDFIDGFARGIKSKVSAVINEVKKLGNKVRSFLHFSRPDEGPLRDYEKWMPDFMEGLAKGIRRNTWKVTAALETTTSGMAGALSAPSYAAENTVANNYSYGDMRVVINAASGQDTKELADQVIERINREVKLKKAVRR